MANQVVKIVYRQDRQYRVLIEQRPDGTFGFAQQKRYGVPGQPDEERWAALPPYATICDSAESAEREARVTVKWLIAEGL